MLFGAQNIPALLRFVRPPRENACPAPHKAPRLHGICGDPRFVKKAARGDPPESRRPKRGLLFPLQYSMQAPPAACAPRAGRIIFCICIYIPDSLFGAEIYLFALHGKQFYFFIFFRSGTRATIAGSAAFSPRGATSRSCRRRSRPRRRDLPSCRFWR